MTVHPKLKPAERLNSLPPYFFHGLNQRIMELRAKKVDVIRMDMGSPDLPPAPFIVEALQKSASNPNGHGYMPFGGTPRYREAWAHFYGKRFGVELDPQTDLVGLLGSKEGVFNLAMAYVNPGDVVLVPDPGYAPYTTGTTMAGGDVVYMPLLAENKFLPDLKSLKPDVLKRTKIMWLNYPNNPTGAVAPLEFFAECVALAREYGFLVAHDAPYMEINFDNYVAPSILQVPGARDVAIEFNSLSKSYNMAGWRTGMAAGNPEAVKALNAWKSNVDSGSFQPILEASAAALTGEQDWLIERNEQYRTRRDIAVEALRAIGFEVEMPKAAIYVWARLPKGANEETYAAELLTKAGVSVTPGTVFGPSGTGYIRLSLGTPTERVREAMVRMREFGV
jgi:LL-diaminopimelate aminotransferase